ncbi:allantoinase-like, partial [Actinidia eriantha]|uniref:allantoinase-like n=1 Tax=Actinidia eriantha TaxID=165200 RepID=UPI00258DD723
IVHKRYGFNGHGRHAHLDDPGRVEWEGFPSGTRAAAAGGLTTLIDMPLNSFPSTVSEETFELELKAAAKRIHVDVGFWGVLVPENAFNRSALEGLLKADVLGLKSFMSPSGINDFPMTNANHIKEGLSVLAKYRRSLLVHAEIEQELEGNSESFMKPRYGYRPLPIMYYLNLKAKSSGDSVTVETCPHYLAFLAEEIQDGDTRFKCDPPIRDTTNREQLWEALVDGNTDMLSIDHSPTVPELKKLNFLKAWGGIFSLQFVLPVTWSYGRNYGVSLEQLASWWSEKPAKLAGLDLKGAIEIGNHADIAVWEPEAEFDLDDSHRIYLKRPSISAYMGSRLWGKVLATFVYKDGKLRVIKKLTVHGPEGPSPG